MSVLCSVITSVEAVQHVETMGLYIQAPKVVSEYHLGELRLECVCRNMLECHNMCASCRSCTWAASWK